MTCLKSASTPKQLQHQHVSSWLIILIAFLVAIHREWMLAAVALFGASLAMAIFCVLYLSWWLGASPDEWEAIAPPAIPIATTCFLAGSVWHVLLSSPFLSAVSTSSSCPTLMFSYCTTTPVRSCDASPMMCVQPERGGVAALELAHASAALRALHGPRLARGAHPAVAPRAEPAARPRGPFFSALALAHATCGCVRRARTCASGTARSHAPRARVECLLFSDACDAKL